MPGFNIFADMLLGPDDDEREYVLREVFGATMRPGQRLPRHSAFAPGDDVAAVLNGASGTLLEAMLWVLPGETEADTLRQAPVRRCIIPVASYHVHGEPEGFNIEVALGGGVRADLARGRWGELSRSSLIDRRPRMPHR